MQRRPQPDPVARWVSHALVGLLAALLFNKQKGVLIPTIAGLGAALLHAELDAPLATYLTNEGF